MVSRNDEHTTIQYLLIHKRELLLFLALLVLM